MIGKTQLAERMLLDGLGTNVYVYMIVKRRFGVSADPDIAKRIFTGVEVAVEATGRRTVIPYGDLIIVDEPAQVFKDLSRDGLYETFGFPGKTLGSRENYPDQTFLFLGE